MAWKDPKRQAHYLKQRKDPKFVAKRKKYLKELYKRKRKQRLAYWRKFRREHPERLAALKRRGREKKLRLMRSQGLSGNGNPLLTKEELYMLQVWCGLERNYNMPKRKRILFASMGAKAMHANEKKRLQANTKKAEGILGKQTLETLQRLLNSKTRRTQSKPRHRRSKD